MAIYGRENARQMRPAASCHIKMNLSKTIEGQVHVSYVFPFPHSACVSLAIYICLYDLTHYSLRHGIQLCLKSVQIGKMIEEAATAYQNHNVPTEKGHSRG